MMRAHRPESVTRGSRRDIFGAALAQSEALWSAGRESPAIVQPILLFYGLTQAARAAVAALTSTGSGDAAKGHGLTIDDPSLVGGTVPLLSDVHVRDHGEGLYQQVATLLGSPTLPVPTSLESLALSLTDSDTFFVAGSAPRPLEVGYYPMEQTGSTDGRLSISLAPLPESLTRLETVDGHDRLECPSLDEIEEWIRPYPRLANLGRPMEVEYVHRPGPGQVGNAARVAWPIPPDHDTFQGRYALARTLVDELGGDTWGYARPTVQGNDAVLAPLLTWWAVLYAFSMLARYHPRAWTRMLDVDRSAIAVPLENVLRRGCSAVPRLVVADLLKAAY